MGVSRDIRDAFGLMTLLPVAAGADRAPSPRVAAWFPWVGLFLGGAALGLLVATNAASVAWSDGGFHRRASGVLAVVVIAGWAAATRFLHWDGLADVADAWWGGHDPARRLEIMADSSIGAFGATAVTLVAVAQVASVSALIGRVGFGIALFAAPVFGRMAATFGAWLGAPARPGGLGSTIAGRPTFPGILVASLALAVAAASMGLEHGPAGWVWAGFGFAAAAAIPHLISLRFGGITGDVLGASVLSTETVLLVAAALVVTW